MKKCWDSKPKFYIDLMKKCWDSNPDNRPNSIEIKNSINLYYDSLSNKLYISKEQCYEIHQQFERTQEYRKENVLSIKNNQLDTHEQAIYISRLLNPFTKNLDDINYNQ
jgi:hypothetical protein